MRGLAEFEGYADGFAITEEVLLQQGFSTNPPLFHAIVAESNGEIIGMLVYYFIPFTFRALPTLYIKELFISSEWRGQGIGAALMRRSPRASRFAAGSP